MSDPFGDLDETLSDDTGGTGDADGGESNSVRPTDEAAEGNKETRVTGDDQQADAADTGNEGTAVDAVSSPAFPFAEADQTAVYPRAETWAAFEDFLDFEVRRQLREAGVRDDTKRELHEAALQVIREHPEAVAEQFLDNRRESGDSKTRS